jgi:hypothetical protein
MAAQGVPMTDEDLGNLARFLRARGTMDPIHFGFGIFAVGEILSLVENEIARRAALALSK